MPRPHHHAASAMSFGSLLLRIPPPMRLHVTPTFWPVCGSPAFWLTCFLAAAICSVARHQDTR